MLGFERIGGVTVAIALMFNVAYIKTYNKWRIIHPAPVTSATEARKRGEPILKRLHPPAPSGSNPKLPRFDYDGYMLNSYSEGNKWVVRYSKNPHRHGPTIKFYADSGKIIYQGFE